MRVALVQELLTTRGGAERVLRVMAEMFPEAPIYTLLYDQKKLGDWFPASRVRTSKLQHSAAFSTNHHLYLSRFPKTVETWDFSGFDLVISSSSAFAHGIITNSAPKHLAYIHSPARYLWDRTHDVLDQASQGILGPFKRAYLSSLFHRLRVWDTEAAERADLRLAASRTVQRRIELYWRQQSDVLYPPIDTFWLKASSQPIRQAQDRRTAHSGLRAYYLIVSTLASYKRIEIAIHACNQRKARLIIVGSGPAERSLRSIAGPTVEFVGYKEGEELRSLYANANATLFPGDEDFGLVPLESLSQGTPVIAYQSGGALETIRDGETGIFFSQPTAESLAEAMERFEKTTFDPHTCTKAIQPYSTDRFKKGLMDAVDRLMKE